MSKFKLFKNKLLGAFVTVPIIFLSTSYFTSQNNYNYSSNKMNSVNNFQNTSSLKYNWNENNNSTTPSYVLPSSFSKKTTTKNNQDPQEYEYNLKDGIKQDKAYDDNNKSMAALTSSTKNGEFDQITKYWLSNAQEEKQDGTYHTNTPGTIDWVVKKSDLSSVINVDDSKTELKSILYSGGSEHNSKVLFVLLNTKKDHNDSSNKGSYLFQIKWEDDNINTNDNFKGVTAGKYRLLRKLSSETLYNYMVSTSYATESIDFFQLDEINIEDSTTSQDVEIKIGQAGSNDFGKIDTSLPSKNRSLTTLKEYKIKIKINDLKEKINNGKYYPSFAYKNDQLGSSLYIVFQQESFSSASDEKSNIFLFKVDVIESENSNEFVVKKDDIFKINVKDDNFIKNKKFNITFLKNNSTSFNLYLTNAEEEKNILNYLKLDLDNLVVDSNLNFEKIELNDEISSLIDVKKTYIPNNITTDGFILLDSQKKVFKLDNNHKKIDLLYDFDSSTFNLGDIWKIETVAGDNSWYVQTNDSSYMKFIDKNLFGQWDKLYENDSYELPMVISPKVQSELKPEVVYKQVGNDEETDWDPTFNNYLGDKNNYKDFLNVQFIDPRLGDFPPNVTIKKKIFGESNDNFKKSEDRNYKIEITIEQTLAKIDSKNINAPNWDYENSKKVTLLTQVYEFKNSIGKIYYAGENRDQEKDETYFDIPSFVRNKLPSEIVNSDYAETFLVEYLNVVGSTNFIPNDEKGTIVATTVIPYMWTDESGTPKLVNNKTETKTLDKDKNGNDLFQKNPLGSTSHVQVIDNSYLEKTENNNLKNQLISKYSGYSPSEAIKKFGSKDIINSFIEFGSAYSQPNNFENGLISEWKDWIINIIPYDDEGFATINLIIPKVANKTNFTINFRTPDNIFLKDKLSNSSIYFMFKDENITETTTLNNEKLNSLKPSQLKNRLSSIGTGDSSIAIETLRYFADFSNYYEKSIKDGWIKIYAEDYSDKYGNLKVIIESTDVKNPLPGTNINKFEKIFTGFKNDNNNSQTNDELKFKDKIENISNISPIDVKSSDLLNSNSLNIFADTNSTTKDKIKEENIKIIASNITGSIEVSVKIENYIENNKALSSKTFTKAYNGFKKSNESIDMIVWKSYFEIITDKPAYTSQLPSDIIESLDGVSDLEKLKIFARVSNEYMNSLNDEDINFTFIPNDNKGIIEIIAIITKNGTTTRLNTIIDGFKENGLLAPKISWVSDSNILGNLKKKLPSQISVEEASKLYNVENTNSFKTNVLLKPDDFKGNLGLEIRVIDDGGTEYGSEKTELTGFEKYIPLDKGTNWTFVTISAIIPLVILIIPIIVMGLYQNIKNQKQISKRLEKRLNEEYKKTKKY